MQGNRATLARTGPALSNETFDEFCRLAREMTGISLGDNKRSMLATRFSRRLRVLGLFSYEEYLEVVKQANHPERVEFVNTLTTNLTYFFREPHHFEHLRSKALPALDDRLDAHIPLRFWCAGCSSGQEPYSVAMTIRETSQMEKRSVKILCTDIHNGLVRQTATGKFNEGGLRGLSPQQQHDWFDKTLDGNWRAKPELRELLICKQLNLFAPWPVRPFLDVIFCRNTLIYFTPDDQQKVLRGFAKLLRPGAYLYIGHSETIQGCEQYFSRVDNTVYERRE